MTTVSNDTQESSLIVSGNQGSTTASIEHYRPCEYFTTQNLNGLISGHELIDSQPQSLDELNYLLKKHSLEETIKELWGKGSSKTIADLWREVKLGITLFSYDQDRRLCRNLTIARIRVKTSINNQIYNLKETEQVFINKSLQKKVKQFSKTQRITANSPIFDNCRRRKRSLLTVNKKVQKEKSIRLTAREALINELNLDENFVKYSLYFCPGLIQTFSHPSNIRHSFPGLFTNYTFYFSEVFLDPNRVKVNEQGYVDIGDRLVSFFKWVPDKE